MTDFGPLDLDEHAAFWARDDEKLGRASASGQFEVEGRAWMARYRTAASSRNPLHPDNEIAHGFFALENGVLLFTRYDLYRSSVLGVSPFHNLNLESVLRSFRVPDKKNSAHGACLCCDGTGQWFYRTRRKNGDLGFLSQSSFRCASERTAAEFFAWPQSEFAAHFERLWQSPASEMRRAWEFDQLPLAQRDQTVTRCEAGDVEELRGLERAFGRWMWSVEPELVGMDLRIDFQRPLLWDWDGPEGERLNQRYWGWREAILRAFQPRYIGRDDAPLFAAQWLQNRALLRVEVQRPTHHEQLEAHLQLRTWAKLHLSQFEQDQLFDLK